jgi:hypothetical protein
MNMSVLTTALLLLAAALPSVRTPPLPQSAAVAVVADPACPVAIEQLSMERTATGIAIVYTLRNNAKDRVKAIVWTAAGVDWTGAVTHVEMVPRPQLISAGASVEQRATFPSAELRAADRIVVGVQAVQWNGGRAEWRGVLTLTAPVALASRN